MQGLTKMSHLIRVLTSKQMERQIACNSRKILEHMFASHVKLLPNFWNVQLSRYGNFQKMAHLLLLCTKAIDHTCIVNTKNANMREMVKLLTKNPTSRPNKLINDKLVQRISGINSSGLT